MYLGLNENDIDNQIYKPQKDQSTCLINVISVWLKMRGKDHTWGILASDLREIKHKIIAEEVEKTYNLEEVGMYHCDFIIGKSALLCDVSYLQYEVRSIFQIC